MLTIFIRAIILYAVTLVTLRALGKNQLGQFQPYEFALALLIADLMATPMADMSTPLLHGVLPVAALFVVHCLLTFACVKSDKLRAVISGKPSLIVSKGVIDRRELERLSMSLSELLEGMRESGVLDPAQLGTAIVEADGKISAFKTSEVCAMPLVMDGRIQLANLQLAGFDEHWIADLLAHYNLRPKDVLLMSLDGEGNAHIQDMKGTQIELVAAKPAEVAW